MDRTEFGNLLDQIGRMIERSTPMKAEYWRGYYQGIKFFYRGGIMTVRDHYHLRKIADMGRSDPFHGAYLRGYRDGCDGKRLLKSPRARDVPSEHDKAAG